MPKLLRRLYATLTAKTIYAYKLIFSSQQRIFRWTFGLNLAIFIACLAVRKDQINLILTNQLEQLSQIEVPKIFRKTLYEAYSHYYQVKGEEVELPYKEYQTFSAFFTRKITRKAAEEIPNTISSPCDGKILKISQVTGDSCHIIKNSHYSLSQLVLGDSTILKPQQSIEQLLKLNQESKLYQIIIYLAPGDYHRFHSPLSMSILKIKSISGNVQPVNEQSLSRSKPIYEKNVRKVVFGRWSYGLLTMVMVGALNVSKIHLNDVREIKRGQQLGYFNLGSTIVLVVEAKGLKQWHVKQGQKIQYGQPLFEYLL